MFTGFLGFFGGVFLGEGYTIGVSPPPSSLFASMSYDQLSHIFWSFFELRVLNGNVLNGNKWKVKLQLFLSTTFCYVKHKMNAISYSKVLLSNFNAKTYQERYITEKLSGFEAYLLRLTSYLTTYWRIGGHFNNELLLQDNVWLNLRIWNLNIKLRSSVLHYFLLRKLNNNLNSYYCGAWCG